MSNRAGGVVSVCLLSLLLVVVAMCALPTSTSAAIPAGASPESVADSMLAAEVRGDWKAAAELVDSADARRFYDSMVPALRALVEDSSGQLAALLGNIDKEKVRKQIDDADPTEFLEQMFTSMVYSPQMGTPTLTEYEIIGAVHEGDSLCHVVSRQHHVTFAGIGTQVESVGMGLTSLRKTNNQWRVILDEKAERAAALLKQVLGSGLGDLMKMMKRATDTGETTGAAGKR